MQARQQGWEDATLILLLLSPDYLASDTCYQEMLNALERQQRGEVRVLPILLRPCDRSAPPLATVRCLPGNGQAVTSWDNQEQAFLDIAQEIRQLIGLPRVVVSGGRAQLPRVRDVALDQLRVHAARVEVPYIERDQQDKLEGAVGPGRAVLVVGHSMSGKTRLAAEVVKQKFPDAPLVTAESGKALRELFDRGLDPEGLVVWLDDLERFLGGGGLTVGLLDRLITGRAIVIATIRILQRETYRPSDKLRPPEWEVLQRFSEILLQRRLTGSELGRVQATVSYPGVLAAVNHYGLAEYLGAGPEALDKFEKGEITSPVGFALVRAAIDWRRTGFTRPVSQQILVRALSAYLADRPDVPRTNPSIEEGLTWATMKINETVALLGQVFPGSNGPSYEAFDYLIDQLTRTSTPVPDLMWDLALEQSESAELNEIGMAARLASKLTIAEAAWRRAADEGDSEMAPRAAHNLGDLLAWQGDLEGAKAAYQRVIDSGHPDYAPSAMIFLGPLLAEQGDLEGAKAAYQRIIDSGHPDCATSATANLGVLLAEQGDLEGAKAAYQRIIDSGHPDCATSATANLGVLLAEQGDLEGAKAAIQQAIDSRHPYLAPRAAVRLGQLLDWLGDLEGAKAAWQQVRQIVEDADPMVGPVGLFLKAILDGLHELVIGDLEGAKAAYQRAIDSEDTHEVSRAASILARALEKQSDLEGAKAAWQQVIASGDADLVPEAAFSLGRLLETQGDLEGAKAAYQRAVGIRDSYLAPPAASHLGWLLERQGDLEGAKAAYQQAIDSEDTHEAPKAAYFLGRLLSRQGDLEGAKAAYQRAIDSDQDLWAPEAANMVELLLMTTPPLATKEENQGTTVIYLPKFFKVADLKYASQVQVELVKQYLFHF